MKDGADATVLVAYDTDTPARTLQVARFAKFAQGESLIVAICTYDNPDQKTQLRWGSLEFNGPSKEIDRFGMYASFNGTIIVKIGSEEQKYNFIIRPKVRLMSSFEQIIQGSAGISRQSWPKVASQNLDVFSESDLGFQLK